MLLDLKQYMFDTGLMTFGTNWVVNFLKKSKQQFNNAKDMKRKTNEKFFPTALLMVSWSLTFIFNFHFIRVFTLIKDCLVPSIALPTFLFTLKLHVIEHRNIPSRGGGSKSTTARGKSSPKVTKSSLAPKLTAPNSDGYKVVCYYTNWSQYR